MERDAVARALLQLDRERKRQIRDVRERVAAIDGERRQHRKDALVERPLDIRLRFVFEIVDTHDANASALERGHEALVEQAHLRSFRSAQALGDRDEVLRRRATVLGASHDLRVDLLFDRRDANHEELVEVGFVDRNELQPLEKRVATVDRLLEDAIVELQPRKLAANERGGVVGGRAALLQRLRGRKHGGRALLRRTACPRLLPQARAVAPRTLGRGQ